MAREERVILTNMCMVYDDKGNILVQDRLNPDWPGVTFPGGHVEPGESFCRSVIREVREETGLTIESPVLCGIKQFLMDNGVRYVVLFFKTNRFRGTLRSSEEGKVFWIPRASLHDYTLAHEFEDMLRIFETEDLSEFYYRREGDAWEKELY